MRRLARRPSGRRQSCRLPHEQVPFVIVLLAMAVVVVVAVLGDNIRTYVAVNSYDLPALQDFVNQLYMLRCSGPAPYSVAVPLSANFFDFSMHEPPCLGSSSCSLVCSCFEVES